MNRINLICLGVRDIVRARAFYRDGLGFTTPSKESDPRVVFFSNSGTRLELYSLEGLRLDVDENNPPSEGSGFPGITLAYCAKSKEEVDDLFARIESLGGSIAKPPQAAFWGGYSGYFRDIDGYYWEAAYWEGWQFDETDMLVID